MDVVDI